jgi:hypothetical protein
MDATWVVIATSAVSGLLAGAVGSLGAPWANWGVEKHRLKLQARARMTHEARMSLKHPSLSASDLRGTELFSRLKAYLRPELVATVEQGNRSADPALNFALLEDLTRLEQEWGLL